MRPSGKDEVARMPTINQLVRHPRQAARAKTKAPALRWRYNALHNTTEWTKGSPQKRGVCAVSYTHLTLPTILRV